MVGIGKSVKIFVYEDQYGEVKTVMEKNLIELCEWYQRAVDRGAQIMPNGMTGMIVITKNRYFDVEVM